MGRMLAVIATLALTLGATLAFAEEWVVRDSLGRKSETVNRESQQRLIRRDPQGRKIGTIEETMPDRLDLRDPTGRRTGRLEREGNNWVERDLTGQRRLELEPDGFGGFIVRDRIGRRTGHISAPH